MAIVISIAAVDLFEKLFIQFCSSTEMFSVLKYVFLIFVSFKQIRYNSRQKHIVKIIDLNFFLATVLHRHYSQSLFTRKPADPMFFAEYIEK